MAWITADDALKILNVRAQTLYANVSRGKIRARRDAGDPRRSLYHRDDVLRLAKRPHGRRKVETVSAEAIEWGDPVLPSAISTVSNGQLWYRGRHAVELSEHATLEDVAGLLWQGEPIRIDASPSRARPATRRPIDDATGPLKAGLMALAERCGDDLPSPGRAAAILRREAGEVYTTLVHAMLGSADRRARGEHSLSGRIATAWRCEAHEDVIRRTLVLLADHELNASTFATRVSVSTGASLSAGVLAGLTTLTGPLHGGASASVKALVDAASQVGTDAAVSEWLALGRPFPAFGHPLYPDGDPRAAALLQQIVVPAGYGELAACVERLVGERPNIDFALAAMTDACRLPRSAPLTLFALSRCAGWLAHALEQIATGKLIRPRARYVGLSPGNAGA